MLYVATVKHPEMKETPVGGY